MVERLDPLDVHLGKFPDRHLPGTEVRSHTGDRGTIQLRERSGRDDRGGVRGD
jgi:hypothetical protein